MNEAIRSIYDGETPKTPGTLLQETTRCAVELAQKIEISEDDRRTISQALEKLQSIHSTDDATRIQIDETSRMLEELLGERG